MDRLLANARAWASRGLVILGDADADEIRESSEEVSALMDAWRETCGLRVEVVHWESAIAATVHAKAVLPLLAWSQYESATRVAQFSKLLRDLRDGGVQPQADLRALSWLLHKQYLLQLSSLGVPIVPTIVLRAATTDAASLRAHMQRLRPAAERNAGPAGGRSYVIKPATGGGGEGVDRLSADDEHAVADILRRLQRGDQLLQPFLSRVRDRGELAFVFVNGELLHAVRKEPAGWDARTSQPIARLDPPPARAYELAQRALDAARGCIGCATPSELYLARVDLLPDSSDGERDDERWLVSELELGWPHLFLRAGTTAGAASSPTLAAEVAKGLMRHLAADPAAAWAADDDALAEAEPQGPNDPPPPGARAPEEQPWPTLSAKRKRVCR